MSTFSVLADEDCIRTWAAYVDEAAQRGVYATLQSHIPRLRFPVRLGMSQNDQYRAVTLRGASTVGMSQATGLALHSPGQLRLFLHTTAAGRIPVIVAPQREDFVALIQALSARNEPIAVPASMGASMIAGFNNWERVAVHRQAWEAQRNNQAAAAGADFDSAKECTKEWPAEFARLVPQHALYQDRFIILQEGFYSAVQPEHFELDAATWRRLSLTIRLEHECAHYFTLRVLGRMQNALHDELLADYAGIVAAIGRFRADWFLRFMGLENYPAYREGGRLQNYRGTPPMSDCDFRDMQQLACSAAHAVERFDQHIATERVGLLGHARALLTLAAVSPDEIAAADGAEVLKAVWSRTQVQPHE
jgi:hypothetical protein